MKETIRELAISLGVDVCGFAAIERFSAAPEGFSPLDLYKDCQTVITFGIALPKGLAEVSPRLLYNHFYEVVIVTKLDWIAFQLSKEIERRYGCHVVPVPCDDPYEYWDAEQMEGRGLISMKHAAICAGLGTLGKSTLLLNAQYGNMLHIGAVLTDLVLPSDPLAESICIDGCTMCVDRCPAGAIQNGTVVQKLCREHTYAQKTAKGYDTVECNTCRIVCPVAFGCKQ